MADKERAVLDDDAVLRHTRAEGQVFITMDVGFADGRRYPPGTHAGILVLRMRKDSETVLRVVTRLADLKILDGLQGCLAVADETRIRIRRPSGSDGSARPSKANGAARRPGLDGPTRGRRGRR